MSWLAAFAFLNQAILVVRQKTRRRIYSFCTNFSNQVSLEELQKNFKNSLCKLYLDFGEKEMDNVMFFKNKCSRFAFWHSLTYAEFAIHDSKKMLSVEPVH